MSAKITASRRGAFLKALGATGNQTLAAARAKVSRSWVLQQRRRDPDFDAAVRQACRDFARHRQAGTKAPRGWGHLDGVELVVRGTGGSGGGKRVQIARARLHQWDPATEDRFLAVLAATCNVRLACAMAGMTPASAYPHRKRWPGFARRWAEAVEMGEDRLAFGLIEAASNLFSAAEVPAELPVIGMTAADALRLLEIQARREASARQKAAARPLPFERMRAKLRAELNAIAAERRPDDAGSSV